MFIGTLCILEVRMDYGRLRRGKRAQMMRLASFGHYVSYYYY